MNSREDDGPWHDNAEASCNSSLDATKGQAARPKCEGEKSRKQDNEPSKAHQYKMAHHHTVVSGTNNNVGDEEILPPRRKKKKSKAKRSGGEETGVPTGSSESNSLQRVKQDIADERRQRHRKRRSGRDSSSLTPSSSLHHQTVGATANSSQQQQPGAVPVRGPDYNADDLSTINDSLTITTTMPRQATVAEDNPSNDYLVNAVLVEDQQRQEETAHQQQEQPNNLVVEAQALESKPWWRRKTIVSSMLFLLAGIAIAITVPLLTRSNQQSETPATIPPATFPPATSPPATAPPATTQPFSNLARDFFIQRFLLDVPMVQFDESQQAAFQSVLESYTEFFFNDGPVSTKCTVLSQVLSGDENGVIDSNHVVYSMEYASDSNQTSLLPLKFLNFVNDNLDVQKMDLQSFQVPILDAEQAFLDPLPVSCPNSSSGLTCFHGGQCPINDDGAMCDCSTVSSPFAGVECEAPATNFCDREGTTFCVHGGVCIAEGECACPTGFFGEKCEFAE